MSNVTQLEAKRQGLTRYSTGKPCKRGHVSERMVSDRSCVACKQLNENRNPNRKRQYSRYREGILERAKTRYEQTGPKIEYTAEWREANKNKIRKYRQDNSGLYAFHAAKRKKLVKAATPPWADLEAIKDLYIEAARLSRETGIPHEVDHIIPIKHGRVCGLHCVENLRIIPATENRSKHNKFRS